MKNRQTLRLSGYGLLTILGIFLLGLVNSVGLLLITDYYYHETVSNVPVAKTLVDMFHIGWEYVKTIFTNPSADVSTPTGSVDIPGPISRSSSGSSTASDITFRDLRTNPGWFHQSKSRPRFTSSVPPGQPIINKRMNSFFIAPPPGPVEPKEKRRCSNKTNN